MRNALTSADSVDECVLFKLNRSLLARPRIVDLKTDWRCGSVTSARSPPPFDLLGEISPNHGNAILLSDIDDIAGDRVHSE